MDLVLHAFYMYSLSFSAFSIPRLTAAELNVLFFQSVYYTILYTLQLSTD